MSVQGVVYSDFDGVHNVPQREGLALAKIQTSGSRFFKDETTIAWDTEIFDLFAELILASGFELSWLTTWNEGSLISLAAEGMQFPHLNHAPAALNHRARGKREWTEWKARHIIADQKKNPRPFIWIDDKAPLYWQEVVEQHTTAPSFILATDSHSGLTREEILQMVLWIEKLGTTQSSSTIERAHSFR